MPLTTQRSNGIAVPRNLWYAPNHLWLQSDEGACHIGIDGFLARILSKVDQDQLRHHRQWSASAECGPDGLRSRLGAGIPEPALDHRRQHVSAPRPGAADCRSIWNRMAIPKPGQCRRENRRTAECYSGLINGEQAHPWIKSEIDRIIDFVHHLDPATMNDGGTPADDFIRHLSRDEVLRLCHAFFASHAVWGRYDLGTI